MKTIGMIGGMSWESTREYYRLLNEGVKASLGGLHSARCLLVSVDFHEIEILQREGRWDEAGDHMADAARRLERGGAQLVILCTNTMHKVSDRIEAAVSIPLLHIADATALAVRAAGIRTVGLLGTRFTMEEEFYAGRLGERHGLSVIVPQEADRGIIHRVIYEELCLGVIDPGSREEFRRIVADLAGAGAQGVILGCTEIGLLLGSADTPGLALFETTRIHAEAAVAFALGKAVPRSP